MSYHETTISASDGVPLFLRVWQPAATPRAILILVHGLGEHAGRYSHVVETFLPRNYVIYGHDHRGFGRSGGKRGDFAQFEDLLIDLDQIIERARHEYPGLPHCLYAHSMGGMIATRYLAEQEEKIAAAVISAPGFGPGPDFSQFKLLLTKALYRLAPGLSIHTGGQEDLRLSHDPAVLKAYQDDPYVHDIVTPRFGSIYLQKGQEAQSMLSTLTLPLFVILGAEDTSINRQAVLNAVANAGSNLTFREYAGGYHELHNEVPEIRDVALAEVAEWMDSVLFA